MSYGKKFVQLIKIIPSRAAERRGVVIHYSRNQQTMRRCQSCGLTEDKAGGLKAVVHQETNANQHQGPG